MRLDVFDLINALLKPKGLQLKALWREADRRFEFVDSEKLNVYVLQVMSMLKQAYCSPKYLYYLLPGQEKTVRNADGTMRKEVLIPTTAEFETRWQEAVSALEGAIKAAAPSQGVRRSLRWYLPFTCRFCPSLQRFSNTELTCAPALQLDAERRFATGTGRQSSLTATRVQSSPPAHATSWTCAPG